jgi:hypothetical protein
VTTELETDLNEDSQEITVTLQISCDESSTTISPPALAPVTEYADAGFDIIFLEDFTSSNSLCPINGYSLTAGDTEYDLTYEADFS